ncbi:OmpA family protein [bacterium]|nr:OmpA family protein [bacterium]
MSTVQDRELEHLRRLLLKDDRTRITETEVELNTLRKQLSEKEWLISTFSPVLNDVIDLNINRSKDDVAKTLSPVIGPAIKHQIGEAKEEIVDALYPIIGKTVRKAVAEAIKHLADTINNKIENAMRRSRVRNQITAKISGVSPQDLILKEALPFSIQEIFLIHRESGLLMTHVSSTSDAAGMNKDLVSGMLTAIQSFADEAFSQNESQDINEIQYGDQRIIIEAANSFYTAIVVKGVTPARFNGMVTRLLDRIQHQCGSELRDFQGDQSCFGSAKQLLSELIKLFRDSQDEEMQKGQSKRPYGLILVASFIVLVLAIWGVSNLYPYLRTSRHMTGLRNCLQADGGFAHVICNIENSRILLSGSVEDIKTEQRLDSLISTHEAVDYVDNRVIIFTLKQSVISEIEHRFQPYTIDGRLICRLHLDGTTVILEGHVSSRELKRHVGYLAGLVSGIAVVENNLDVSNSIDSKALIDDVEEDPILFASGSYDLNHRQMQELDSLAEWLISHRESWVIIKGFSDQSGSENVNNQISEKRAGVVRVYLFNRGVSHAQLAVQYFGSSLSPKDAELSGRRVELEIRDRR